MRRRVRVIASRVDRREGERLDVVPDRWESYPVRRGARARFGSRASRIRGWVGLIVPVSSLRRPGAALGIRNQPQVPVCQHLTLRAWLREDVAGVQYECLGVPFGLLGTVRAQRRVEVPRPRHDGSTVGSQRTPGECRDRRSNVEPVAGSARGDAHVEPRVGRPDERDPEDVHTERRRIPRLEMNLARRWGKPRCERHVDKRARNARVLKRIQGGLSGVAVLVGETTRVNGTRPAARENSRNDCRQEDEARCLKGFRQHETPYNWAAGISA